MILTGLIITFLKEFFVGLGVALPLILSLAGVIIFLGQAVRRKEGWSRFDGFYWSFVTATTVGYGDLRPTHRRSRVLAIFIAILGLTMTGIIVAIAVHAGSVALDRIGY